MQVKIKRNHVSINIGRKYTEVFHNRRKILEFPWGKNDVKPEWVKALFVMIKDEEDAGFPMWSGFPVNKGGDYANS